MTHQEILNKTKAEIDSLCAQAKEKLDAMAPNALEIGKWYKTERTLFNHQDGYDSYGFFNKQWTSGDWRTYLDDFAFVTPIEATPQEVEKALIEGAKKRAHAYTEYDYNPEENELCGINNGRLESVFCDGHWEQPVDKFAELKEAHRNGAVIQLKMGNRWFDCDPVWTPIFTYRIKPEEGLQYFNLTQLTEIVKEQTKSMSVINERLIKIEGLIKANKL